MDEIKDFLSTHKNKIIIVIVVILIILIIVCVIRYTKTKESFGKLQRVKLLAEAANRVNNESTENFNGPRTDMMFPGQFDYLKPNTIKASDLMDQAQQAQQAPTQQKQQIISQQIVQPTVQQTPIEQQKQQIISQQIAQPAIQQIQKIQQTQQSKQGQPIQQVKQVQPIQQSKQSQPGQQISMTQQPQIKRQVLQQVQQRIQPQAVQQQLIQSTQQPSQLQHQFDESQMINNQHEVQSNSGNSLQSKSAESFGHSRIYRQFENLMGGIVASEEAQKADQTQTSVDMKVMEQQLA